MINHDFTSTLDLRMKQIEIEEREEELKKFRMLKLKAEAEQRLRESIALAEQKSEEVVFNDGLLSGSEDDREEEELIED